LKDFIPVIEKDETLKTLKIEVEAFANSFE
jgi:hypothetical protein